MKKLYILSSGAGGTKYMTTEALDALSSSLERMNDK
jgi:precorrin-2 methylase